MSEQLKTSSTLQSLIEYEVRGLLRYDGYALKDVKVLGDQIIGTWARTNIDKSRWKVPPHIALANLRTIDANGNSHMNEATAPAELRADPRAVEKFFTEYGLLNSENAPNFEIAADGVSRDFTVHEQMSEVNLT